MFSFGTFDGKKDLGIHSAIITPGLLGLIRRGIVNGNRKSVNPGKSVSGGFRRIVKPEDISFINGNPHFLVRDMAYINDIRVIASHDNLIAINGVLAVDLTGQIAADSLGTRMFGGAGGQVEFVIGSILSNGGHSITVLRSTTRDGKISRITPTLENGTVVSISRTFADYVITEYGIASLWGKSQRERAAALISIAHPDFRDELQKQAKELF
jgi:acyl-CoA hydrolase